ncbi:MAG: peptide deformylase [Candidatus Paceibacterota bacterium]
MKIVTIPHPTLRMQAELVTDFGTDFQNLVKEMQTTLRGSNNPRGVGLAANQIDVLYRMFLTDIQRDDESSAEIEPKIFINPIITKHSDQHTFGPDPEEPRLEGCLSMPGLYGAVPRWEWVEVEFQSLKDKQVIEKKERFDGFHARVVQHELDHLDGILFTDYSLEFGLPVYREKGKELVEITDRSALELY